MTLRASIGRPLKCSTLRSFAARAGIELHAHQRQHLGVAVLLDHVDAIVAIDEVGQVAR